MKGRKRNSMQKRTPTVGIVVLKGQDVLLVRHGKTAGHITGIIGTPGGRIDSGENPIIAAKRELEEETGLQVEKEDLIELSKKYDADFARKDGSTLFTHHTVFACNKFSGEFRATEETTPEWTPINKLSVMTLMANTEDMVKEAQKVLERNKK